MRHFLKGVSRLFIIFANKILRVLLIHVLSSSKELDLSLHLGCNVTGQPLLSRRNLGRFLWDGSVHLLLILHLAQMVVQKVIQDLKLAEGLFRSFFFFFYCSEGNSAQFSFPSKSHFCQLKRNFFQGRLHIISLIHQVITNPIFTSWYYCGWWFFPLASCLHSNYLLRAKNQIYKHLK